MKSKRVLLVLLMALIVLISSVNFVYADSFSVDATSDKQNYAPGQTVIIKIKLSNIDSSAGLYGLSGVLEYDTSVFEAITADEYGNTDSMTALNNWSSPTFDTSGNNFAILTTSPAKGEKEIMQLSLKVKDGATLGKTTVILNKLKASNGESDVSTSPVTVSVNIANSSGGGEIPSIPEASPTPSQPTTSPSKAPSSNVTTIKPNKTPTPSGNLPQTGREEYILPLLFGTLILSLISYVAYKRYKGI